MTNKAMCDKCLGVQPECGHHNKVKFKNISKRALMRSLYKPSGDYNIQTTQHRTSLFLTLYSAKDWHGIWSNDFNSRFEKHEVKSRPYFPAMTWEIFPK